jgi:C-terminal processing protease CtpA/Prc
MLVVGGGAETPYRGRVAVLTDRLTGSAAEAVAGALQEAGLAVTVGARTAGGMLSGETFSIAPGWNMVLPLLDFRLPSGSRIEGLGVAPDYSVGAVESDETGDRVLQRALEVLSGR